MTERLGQTPANQPTFKEKAWALYQNLAKECGYFNLK